MRRLRHHASLALWCGNNEIEDMSMGWKAYIKLNQWTEKFFYQILPDFVKKLDELFKSMNDQSKEFQLNSIL